VMCAAHNPYEEDLVPHLRGRRAPGSKAPPRSVLPDTADAAPGVASSSLPCLRDVNVPSLAQTESLKRQWLALEVQVTQSGVAKLLEKGLLPARCDVSRCLVVDTTDHAPRDLRSSYPALPGIERKALDASSPAAVAAASSPQHLPPAAEGRGAATPTNSLGTIFAPHTANAIVQLPPDGKPSASRPAVSDNTAAAPRPTGTDLLYLQGTIPQDQESYAHFQREQEALHRWGVAEDILAQVCRHLRAYSIPEAYLSTSRVAELAARPLPTRLTLAEALSCTREREVVEALVSSPGRRYLAPEDGREAACIHIQARFRCWLVE
jgi:hypothetical protein